MPFSFEKMHANGDDFAVIDLRGRADTINQDVAKRLGDRNGGIGFNQRAVLTDCEDAAARPAFWNPDGSMLDVLW